MYVKVVYYFFICLLNNSTWLVSNLYLHLYL
jgi:hypothetical protein